MTALDLTHHLVAPGCRRARLGRETTSVSSLRHWMPPRADPPAPDRSCGHGRRAFPSALVRLRRRGQQRAEDRRGHGAGQAPLLARSLPALLGRANQLHPIADAGHRLCHSMAFDGNERECPWGEGEGHEARDVCAKCAPQSRQTAKGIQIWTLTYCAICQRPLLTRYKNND